MSIGTNLLRITIIHLAVERGDGNGPVESHAASAEMRRTDKTPYVVNDHTRRSNECRATRKANGMECNNAVWRHGKEVPNGLGARFVVLP
ncbi:MAG: hypothetical protein JO076_01455 [Verrucomicrobia bacterium]|nr:hypothetical protein [Verrucomicrobiota bacterium]